MSNADQNPDEVKAREIIYKDNFFKQYADIVPEVGEKLERYVFDVRDALSSLRAERYAEYNDLSEKSHNMLVLYEGVKAENDRLKDAVNHLMFKPKTPLDALSYNELQDKIKSLEDKLASAEKSAKDKAGNLVQECAGWTKTVKGLERKLAEAVGIIDRLLDNGGGVKLFDAVKSARDFLDLLKGGEK